MIENYLSKNTIRLNLEASNWEEAVREGGQLLVDALKCQPRYVDAMVQTVRQLGPYIVLAPGLALAHARPEDGVLDIGLSLITLARPVSFGSKTKDPVSIIISFCAVDQNGHVELLRELAEFLRPLKNQRLLNNAVTPDQVMALFSRKNEWNGL